MQSYLSRGLCARYSPQVHSHRTRTAVSQCHAAPTPRLQVTSPGFESRCLVSLCIYKQKFSYRSFLTETCVLGVQSNKFGFSPAEPPETIYPESHFLRLTCRVSCCYLPLMSNTPSVMSVLTLTISTLSSIPHRNTTEHNIQHYRTFNLDNTL